MFPRYGIVQYGGTFQRLHSLDFLSPALTSGAVFRAKTAVTYPNFTLLAAALALVMALPSACAQTQEAATLL